MLGARVPVELRIFLTAAAIVDDIGAIVVVALFYSGALNFALSRRRRRRGRRARAAQSRRRLSRDAVRGARRRAVGLRARGRLARDARRRDARVVHPDAAAAEPERADGAGRYDLRGRGETWRRACCGTGRPLPALRALDAIHDRLESPADRLLRHVAPRSSYFVLPMFALANAGVALVADVLARP